MQRAGSSDGRHPSGGRARLIAALAALVALVAPLIASGSASGGSPDREVVMAVRDAGVAATRLDALVDQAQGVVDSVDTVSADVHALGVEVERGRLEALGERRALVARVRASRAAAAHAADRIIPATTDPDALGRPLDIVSAAIHQTDDLAISALDVRARVDSEERRVRALGVTIRQTRFRLETTARSIEATLNVLNAAVRTAWTGGAGPMVRAARRAPARGAVALGALHDAELALRGAESDLAAISSRVEDWSLGARRAIRTSRRTLSELYGDMLLVQEVVSGLVPSFSSVFDGVTAPPVAISGNGPLYVCPVDEPRSYSDDWGAPRYAGGFHLHQGNDIFAADGTPIRAPFDGTAVATPNTLGGNAVTVYGADGYAYNAHLSAYGTLGEVTAGTIIGAVGDTGDADGGAPHDHFEWHPDNGAAVDPFPYLNAVC